MAGTREMMEYVNALCREAGISHPENDHAL
jgi:hypothetical protein